MISCRLQWQQQHHRIHSLAHVSFSLFTLKPLFLSVCVCEQKKGRLIASASERNGGIRDFKGTFVFISDIIDLELHRLT